MIPQTQFSPSLPQPKYFPEAFQGSKGLSFPHHNCYDSPSYPPTAICNLKISTFNTDALNITFSSTLLKR